MARFLVGIVVGVVLASAAGAHAMSVEETLTRTAAIQHGVDPDWLARTARCESSWNRYAVSPDGFNLGLFQLNRYGLLPAFYAWATAQGLEPDVFSPSQQANFSAEQFAAGHASAWTCA